ncbi:MAG: hypothetical protein ACYTFA_13370 [Planctomycetota bacterium]
MAEYPRYSTTLAFLFAMARREEVVAELAVRAGREPVSGQPGGTIWTDDYRSIFDALRWR